MTLFEGISARVVETPRLSAGVLERDGDDHATDRSRTIVFLHGIVGSAEIWQKTMLALPRDVRLLSIDLRGYGRSETLPVDAKQGLEELVDDLHEVLTALELADGVHLAGWSLGAAVALRYMMRHPVLSVTLQAPIPPFGFGGTRRDGSRLTADDAGAGAGVVDPDFVARIAAEDESTDAPTSPRSMFRSVFLAPGYVSRNEDVWIDSMLTTATGDCNFPGIAVASSNWPGFAPGATGVVNAVAPGNFTWADIVDASSKPPILWVHGERDVLVSDTSLFDANELGRIGRLPDWPGEEMAPSQPMIQQTRDVLDAYAAAGGRVIEASFAGVGHSPHLEEPEDFRAALLHFIDYEPQSGPPTETFILRSAD